MELYIFMGFIWIIGYLYTLGAMKKTARMLGSKYKTRVYFSLIFIWPTILSFSIRDDAAEATSALIKIEQHLESMNDAQQSVEESARVLAVYQGKTVDIMSENVSR